LIAIVWFEFDVFGIAGDAIDKLANTYGWLGMHSDALVLKERVLELRQRVLPEDHPDIGEVNL
jgi:hypothetical protein